MDQDQYINEDSASDQAIEWLARLRADDVTAAEVADFATWLANSSRNKVAFDEATELWHLLNELPVQVTQKPIKRRVYNTALPLAAAASVVFACVMMVLQLTVPSFSTGHGEQRRVILADGSTAFLNTSSKISIHFSRTERRIHVDSGEIWFDVTKNPSRPFIVEGRYASARAVGTAFTVRETLGYTRVGVTEGTVSFNVEAGQAVNSKMPSAKLLQIGQQATASEGFTDLQPYATDTALAWQRGQLVYDDVRLDELVKDLNRYLPTPMTVNGSNLESRRVSAVLYLEDQSAMLEALSKTLPIRWKSVSDSLIIITSDR